MLVSKLMFLEKLGNEIIIFFLNFVKFFSHLKIMKIKLIILCSRLFVSLEKFETLGIYYLYEYDLTRLISLS